MNQPLAYVHPGAKIAKNVVIEPFTTIHNNVEIGEGTWIGSNVTIMEGARIGKNCNIFPGAVIAAVPQDLKFGGEDSLAIIGDNTTVRECVTINRGTIASGQTKIGKNCLIMATAHIAHDCHIGDNAIIVNGVALAARDSKEVGDAEAVRIAEEIERGVARAARRRVDRPGEATTSSTAEFGGNLNRLLGVGPRDRRGAAPEEDAVPAR